jgi:hypothetical protein
MQASRSAQIRSSAGSGIHSTEAAPDTSGRSAARFDAMQRVHLGPRSIIPCTAHHSANAQNRRPDRTAAKRLRRRWPPHIDLPHAASTVGQDQSPQVASIWQRRRWWPKPHLPERDFAGVWLCEGDFATGIREAASHGSSALNFRIADTLGAAGKHYVRQGLHLRSVDISCYSCRIAIIGSTHDAREPTPSSRHSP